MEPHKQIKAVAQTYLQEQQLREQAEYIALLENTIEVIAKELGVEPQQLINELNVGGAIKTGFQQGGLMGAVKSGLGALKTNIKNRGVLGSVVPGPMGGRDLAIGGAYQKAEGKVDALRKGVQHYATQAVHGSDAETKAAGAESSMRMKGKLEKAAAQRNRIGDLWNKSGNSKGPQTFGISPNPAE